MSILTERRYSLADAARKVGVHVSTVHRWRLRGVRGVVLKTVMIGGRRYVLETALNSFLAGLNSGHADPTDEVQRRADAAGKVLDAMGVQSREEGK